MLSRCASKQDTNSASSMRRNISNDEKTLFNKLIIGGINRYKRIAPDSDPFEVCSAFDTLEVGEKSRILEYISTGLE